jgi:hypothetical protein
MINLFSFTRVTFFAVITAVIALNVNPVKAVPGAKQLERQEADISIVGDDSFITGRFYRRLRGRVEVEWFEFKGGGFGWTYTDPGTTLITRYDNKEGALKNEIVGYFNKFIVTKKNHASGKEYDLRVTFSDIKKSESQYGEYSWVSKSGNDVACFAMALYFGDRASRTDSIANQKFNTGACWTPDQGSLTELETFMHRLISNIRLDKGAINKLKTRGM